MSERFDEVFSALEQQASDLTARLESARARIRELEDTNRQLTARLGRIQQMSEAEDTHSAAPSAMPDNDMVSVAVAFEGAESGVESDDREASCVAAPDVAGASKELHSAAPESEDASLASEKPSISGHSASAAPGAVEDISPQALLKQWYKRYPKTFFERHTRPLAIGIHEALSVNEPYSEKLIRRALAGYVNLPRYLKSVRANAARIDLEGNEAGRVEEEDARHAQEQLKRLQQRQQEREAEKQKRRLAQKMSELAHRHQR
ncbi:ProP effector [Kushneria avicenniae]|uniref:ProP effector n=1 Tax=Kushneria avicenniae TaxID=402385 RepID=A0A1I1IAX8_9GAMM|nr:ProQ/FINO family protein [Kushneria avicenniae]SFC33509.1 ProP effector [Kushneria avicenniae]